MRCHPQDLHYTKTFFEKRFRVYVLLGERLFAPDALARVTLVREVLAVAFAVDVTHSDNGLHLDTEITSDGCNIFLHDIISCFNRLNMLITA